MEECVMSQIEMCQNIRYFSLKKVYTVPDDRVQGVTRRQLRAALGRTNRKLVPGYRGWQGRVDGRPFMIFPADPGASRQPKAWAFRVKYGSKWIIGEILKLAKRHRA
jgi:hypothetical protein